MAWSCDGNRLASGSFDKTVTIWNLESDRLVGMKFEDGFSISTFDLIIWTNSSKSFVVVCIGERGKLQSAFGQRGPVELAPYQTRGVGDCIW